MIKLFTGYTVVDEQNQPYALGGNGILYDSSEREPPAIFPTRREAQRAATRSLEYGMKKKRNWKCSEYRIQGVRNA